MSDLIACGQAEIDFSGGMILSLHAVRLLCEDETEHEGFWPFQGEGMANDAMRLGGIITMQKGPSGEPSQCQIAPQNLGDNYEDNRSFTFDRELARYFLPARGSRPAVCNALLLLVEEDYGGMNWDEGVKKILKEVSGILKSGVSSAVGAAIGTAAGPFGTAIGAGVGLIVGEAIAALQNLDSDIFPPADTTFAVAEAATGTTQTIHLRFKGHGGQYLLTLEWRLRELPIGRRVALQAANGEYVVAEGGGGRQLFANRSQIGPWETFGLLRRGTDQISLLAINGDYVCAEGGGGRELVANRSWIGSWEVFRMIQHGGGLVSLRGPNGQFVCAENGGGRELVANRPSAGEWERFRLVEL